MLPPSTSVERDRIDENISRERVEDDSDDPDDEPQSDMHGKVSSTRPMNETLSDLCGVESSETHVHAFVDQPVEQRTTMHKKMMMEISDPDAMDDRLFDAIMRRNSTREPVHLVHDKDARVRLRSALYEDLGLKNSTKDTSMRLVTPPS